MKNPGIHDDRMAPPSRRTAITNALLLNGKKLPDVKIVCSGAGAAAIATLNLLVSMGGSARTLVCDSTASSTTARNTTMDRWKAVYTQKTDARYWRT